MTGILLYNVLLSERIFNKARNFHKNEPNKTSDI